MAEKGGNVNITEMIGEAVSKSGMTVDQGLAYIERAIAQGKSNEHIEQLYEAVEKTVATQADISNRLVALAEKEADAQKFASDEEAVVKALTDIGDDKDKKEKYLKALGATIGFDRVALLDPSASPLRKMMSAPISKSAKGYEDIQAMRKAHSLAVLSTALNEGGVKEQAYKNANGEFDEKYIVNKSKYAYALDRFDAYNLDGVDLLRRSTGANLAMDSVTATEGLEWVPTEILASNVIEDVWLECTVAGLFDKIGMPGPVYSIPRENDFPVAFNFSESTAVANYFGNLGPQASGISTDKMTFTAKKFGIVSFLSDELIADSNPDVLARLQKSFTRAQAYGMDDACINGSRSLTDLDNQGTDGNRLWANTTDQGDGVRLNTRMADMRYTFDGIRKRANASSKVASAAFARSEILAVRRGMGKYGTDHNNLVLLTGPRTYINMMLFNEYVTVQNYGDNAVVKRGEMGRFEDIPVIVNPKVYENLNANGVFDNTTTNKSEVILVRPDAYAWGIRAGARVESERQILSQQRTVIWSMRGDFEKLLKPSANSEGLLYNVA